MSASKKFKIDIDGGDGYVADVESHLDVIAKNPVGEIILSCIRDDDDDLTIVPFTGEDAKSVGSCNAFARPDNHEKAWMKGVQVTSPVYEKGKLVRENLVKVHGKGIMIGSGKGSDVKVHFSSDEFQKADCDVGPGSEPDVVLFHELVHGHRMMKGRLNRAATSGNHENYDNEEEFLAIVVANVYISAKLGLKASMRLRAHHRANSPLIAPYNTSARFLTEYQNVALLAKLQIWEKGLFEDMALINTQFNPIRELLFNAAKYGLAHIFPRINTGPFAQRPQIRPG